jgi:hypothetical protein
MRQPPQLRRCLGLLVLAGTALLIGGCEIENVIIVTNTSSTQLRVFVKVPGGGITTVTPTPGNSSSIVIGEGGTFYAGAVIDTEWLERIRLTRELLSQQLADADVRRRLSVDELKELSDRINDMTREIQRATERPWENVGGCSGTASVGDGGMFETEDVQAATITITDNPAGGFPAFLLVCTSS